MHNSNLSKIEIRAMQAIRNSLVHRGRPPSVRELMVDLGYRSPRSASLIIEKLTSKGFLRRDRNKGIKVIKDIESEKGHVQTVNVPLVGDVSCGLPIFAEENIEATFPVSTSLARPPHSYFLLRAQGDSMNKGGIEDGDLLLVRQQDIAENGDKVLALIDDEATVKEFYVSRNAVVLRPRSTNKAHKPIIVSSDFKIQGIIVAVIPATQFEY